jgi:hypothetical protein
MSIPPSSEGLLDDAAAMICILHVARDEHSLPAGVLHESLSFLGIFVLAEIGNEHVGTLAPWRF